MLALLLGAELLLLGALVGFALVGGVCGRLLDGGTVLKGGLWWCGEGR